MSETELEPQDEAAPPPPAESTSSTGGYFDDCFLCAQESPDQIQKKYPDDPDEDDDPGADPALDPADDVGPTEERAEGNDAGESDGRLDHDQAATKLQVSNEGQHVWSIVTAVLFLTYGHGMTTDRALAVRLSSAQKNHAWLGLGGTGWGDGSSRRSTVATRCAQRASSPPSPSRPPR